MTRAFPWDDVMALGLGRLRLAPAAFWALTPREFASLARAFGPRPGERPKRDDLEALMRSFPDLAERKHGQ
jgi:uncharacterized phage protein (TIGR02216 family)